MAYGAVMTDTNVHIVSPMLTPDQYAAQDGAPSLRTLMRWLKDGEVPGAVQDSSRRWMIPADAVRVPASKPMATRQAPAPESSSMIVMPHVQQKAPVQAVVAPTSPTVPKTDLLPRPVAPRGSLTLEQLEELAGQVPPVALLDQCPVVFIPLRTAAKILGVSSGMLIREREYYQLIQESAGRSYKMPQARIRDFIGK